MASDSDFVQQLSFYGAYHSDFGNQVVHMIFVPLLLWSLFAGAAAVSWPKGKQAWWMNLSTPLFLFYALYYMAFDRVVGTLAAAIYLAVYLSANALVYAEKRQKDVLPKGASLRIAVAMHVVSWVLQVFVGHGLLEGRKPALFDSLWQALTMAPLFVVYETLFMMGFRQDLQQKININVARMHHQWERAAVA